MVFSVGSKSALPAAAVTLPPAATPTAPRVPRNFRRFIGASELAGSRNSNRTRLYGKQRVRILYGVDRGHLRALVSQVAHECRDTPGTLDQPQPQAGQSVRAQREIEFIGDEIGIDRAAVGQVTGEDT